MDKLPQNVSDLILERIKAHGKGWVFTPAHFKDLGSRDAVASALKRYKQEGVIRSLNQGLYDYPEVDPQLGSLQPSVDNIAKALAEKDATRIQASGAYAANLLGLSTQVPMKVVYLTDGRSRKVQIGNQQIILKQTTPRNMATAGKISGLIIQALRHLRQQNVDEEIITRLDRCLDENARKQLMADICYAPAWIADIFRKLAGRNATV